MSTAAQALENGWKQHQAGQHKAAETVYRKVLQADPRNANAWCYLGIVCHDQDRFDEAVVAYRNAIQIQPNFPVAYNNLGNTLRLMRRLDEAIACFDNALRLKPDYVNAHKNKGTALVWEGHLDQALESYSRALELDETDAEVHKNLGVIRLLQGKFADGWKEYEWRWKTSETADLDFTTPKWDGSSLHDKTILLVAEQGLGDTIHFVRYASVLKQRYDCRVIVACQKALLPLLNSFDGADQFVDYQSRPVPEHDCYCPLVSVPSVLSETEATIPSSVPYLSADENLVEQWKQRLQTSDGYRIGITWQGNPKHQADRMRSFPLSELAPLAGLTGIRLFSLQKGSGSEQLDSVCGRIDVVDLGSELDEQTGAFVETAAVLKNLDLLVTADTAIAHLAGALAVPVWVALPRVPDWRWLLDRDDSPWYPTMRLFRQQKVNDWPGVFARIAEVLIQQSDTIQQKPARDYRVAATGFNRLVAARHGMMLYNHHDQYIGRSLELYGEFSEGEVDLFDQLIREGSVVIEAGANIGAHTLPIAKRVGERGRVYAFEPQRVIFQTLCGNMALNSLTNVACLAQAVGESDGTIIVPALDQNSANNFGGLGLGKHQQGETVPVVKIDDLKLNRVDFLKADVEGMEAHVIRGAKDTIARCRPILYLENDRMESSAELIELVGSMGYDMYWHLPPLFNPKNYFRHSENAFGQIVSVNMLCIHSSVNSNIQGLRRIEGPDSDWRVRTV